MRRRRRIKLKQARGPARIRRPNAVKAAGQTSNHLQNIMTFLDENLHSNNSNINNMLNSTYQVIDSSLAVSRELEGEVMEQQDERVNQQIGQGEAELSAAVPGSDTGPDQTMTVQHPSSSSDAVSTAQQPAFGPASQASSGDTGIPQGVQDSIQSFEHMVANAALALQQQVHLSSMAMNQAMVQESQQLAQVENTVQNTLAEPS